MSKKKQSKQHRVKNTRMIRVADNFAKLLKKAQEQSNFVSLTAFTNDDDVLAIINLNIFKKKIKL